MRKLLNGVNVTYRFHRGDNKKTVLLLHGWGGNLNSFRFLENYLINNNFSVLTIDFPGFGGSDLPREDFDLEDYAKIIEELLKVEGISTFCMVAHSFGGRVAMILASQLKNRVEKLVLVDSAGIKPKFSLSKALKIWRYKFLKKLKQKGLIKRDLSNFGSEDYKAMPDGLKVVFNRIVNTDLSDKLKDITAQTLIIWGRDDKDTPYYMAKKINKNIKDSAIITFEGGHFAYLDNAERFCIIVNEFLK